MRKLNLNKETLHQLTTVDAVEGGFIYTAPSPFPTGPWRTGASCTWCVPNPWTETDMTLL